MCINRGDNILKRIVAKVINRLGIIGKVNFNCITRVNNREIVVPIIAGHGYGNLDVSEQWMLAVLEKVLANREGVFVDVGVNLAQTLIKVKAVNDEIDYIGFEPNPVCVFYTRELIKANSFERTTVVPVGLFSDDDLMELDYYSANEADSAASLVKDYRPDQPVIRKAYVPVFSYESICKCFPDNKPVACIKIDVEGAELEVLQSIAPLIEEHRPHILIEILPVYSEDNSGRLEKQIEIEKLLSGLDYQANRIIKPGGIFMDFESIESFGVHSDLEKCDYLLSPGERPVECNKTS